MRNIPVSVHDGTLIERLTSPNVNLGPAPVKHTDGSVRHPGLDNHGIGSYQTDSVKVGYEICPGTGVTLIGTRERKKRP